MRFSRARGGALVVFVAGAYLALVGCEAVLDVSALTERSATSPSSDGGQEAATTIDAGEDAAGEDGGCTIPAGAACAVDPQCGCPANQKCDLPNGNAACVAVGTSAPGDLCTDVTDCVAGTTCTNGVCHAFCTTPGAQCPAGGISAEPQGVCTANGGNTVQGFLCPLTCSLAPNSCTQHAGCVVVPDADGGVFADCEQPGTGGNLASCATDNDCIAGYGCTVGSCYQWCELSPKTTGCAVGACHGPAAATIDGIAYGYCY